MLHITYERTLQFLEKRNHFAVGNYVVFLFSKRHEIPLLPLQAMNPKSHFMKGLVCSQWLENRPLDTKS